MTNREKIKARARKAVANIIRTSRVISDCCGSAVLKNFNGENICADCLESCCCVEVKR